MSMNYRVSGQVDNINRVITNLSPWQLLILNLLTFLMYSFPVRVKSWPPMLKVISGKVGIILQSIVYCNDHNVI